MIVTLYRYSHPTISDKWIYVGQGDKRDSKHRLGKSSFGRRYKTTFPTHILSQPVKWCVQVANQLEANTEETIAMFQYHTWRGYEGGMNLIFPASTDYQHLGKLAGQIAKDNGHLDKIRTIEGSRKGGLKAVQNRAGLFSPIADPRAWGIKAARVNKQNGTALYDPKINAKGRQSQKDNKTGFYDPETLRKIAQAGVATQRRQGLGLFNPVVREKGRIASLTPKARMRANRTMKEQGTGLFDPKVREKGRKAAIHFQEQNNRGVWDPVKGPIMRAKAQETLKKNRTGLWDPAVRALGAVKRKHEQRRSLHRRWDVNRGITNPDCPFCSSIFK